MEKIEIKVNELCAGVGMQLRGIQNTPCFKPNVMAISEINKDAVLAYAAVHCGLTDEMVEQYEYPPIEEMKQYLTDINLGYIPEKDQKYDWFKNGKKHDKMVKKYWLACKLSNNLGDVTGIDMLPYADVWFLSFPCQSISVAGKLNGMSPDSGTRSSLVWQTIRLLKKAEETKTLPKYMMLENVKNLVGKKFIKDFNTFNDLIKEFGYNVYWQVINGKDTGVPQNRERVFAIYIRDDIDKGMFTFPKPFDNGLRLKDVLEEHVDEKYYINTPKSQQLIQRLINDGIIPDEESENKAIDLSVKQPREIDVANCVSARTDRGISNRQAEGSGVFEIL